jgi:Ca2+-binding EF-hand superfamily protein
MKRLPLFLAWAVLCASLALTPSLAFAGDDEGLPPTSQFFDEYDTNSDGKVTKDEFRGAAEVFKLLDEDGDGAITPTELGLPADFKPDPKRKRPGAGREAPAKDRGAAQRERMAKLLEQLKAMDTNQDGKVSKDEWKGPEKMFARLDRNKDGVIDMGDRQAGVGGEGRRGKAGKGRPGGEGGGDPAQMAERVKQHVQKQFAKLDANQDGKVTQDEAPNPRLLEMADKNGDGAITLEELQAAALERVRQRAGAGGKSRKPGKGGGGAPREGKPRERRGPRITNATLKRWDRDGDEKVSADEFPGGDQTFARLDVDKDGFLTAADLKALKKRAKKEGRKPGESAPGAKPEGAGKGMIERMDADGDGRLHRGEFRGPDDVWKKLDSNKDGWITPDELP